MTLVDDDELAEALAEAVDEDGNDVRLADRTARMTAEDRAASEANVRAWVARARRGMRSRRDEPSEV